MERKQINELFDNYIIAKNRRKAEDYRTKLEAANLEFQQNHWEELTIDTITDMPDSEFKKFEQTLFDLESGKRWEEEYIKNQATNNKETPIIDISTKTPDITNTISTRSIEHPPSTEIITKDIFFTLYIGVGIICLFLSLFLIITIKKL
jgi:hypothetical protein